MNTLQTKPDWKCEDWKYIYDASGSNDADFCEMVGVDDERRRENTLLICSAPDMLEALEYVVEKIDDDDVLEKCINVIFKAKGLRLKSTVIQSAIMICTWMMIEKFKYFC